MARARKAAKGATPVETFVHGVDERSNIPTAELENFLRNFTVLRQMLRK